MTMKHMTKTGDGSEEDERHRRVTQLYYNNSIAIATFIEKNLDKNYFFKIYQNYGFGRFVDVRQIIEVDILVYSRISWII